MDADIIMLNDIVPLWEKLKFFNEKQIVGIAPDIQVDSASIYKNRARYPFYGEYGLNTGVMLTNLTRWREFQPRKKIATIYQKYKEQIIIREQCLLNIFFSSYPGIGSLLMPFVIRSNHEALYFFN